MVILAPLVGEFSNRDKLIKHVQIFGAENEFGTSIEKIRNNNPLEQTPLKGSNGPVQINEES
ncbi:5171_t:CDS:2, partial [Gigaspora rosea]